MNQLNQIILEGNIDSFELKKDPVHGAFLDLRIVHEITGKDTDGCFVTSYSYFNVYLFGQMIDRYKERLRAKRGVRLVGKLKEERWQGLDNEVYNRIVIIAEHIELKLMKKILNKGD